MDYIELYDNLGERLLSAIDAVNSMERSLQKKANASIKLGGSADGTAAKYQLRMNLKKTEIEAITNAIKVIQPLAEMEKKVKEYESKNKQLEEILKQLEEQTE